MQASSDDGFNLHIDHSTEIIGHVSALFKSKDYSDISLVVGGTQFLAHRVILASRCDYFRALLFGGLSETHSSTIHLNGINSTAFYHVLGYIYTGRLDISGLTIGDALDILGLVCQYNFPNLENALSAHFVRSLTPNNVCQIYDAAITYDLDDLIDACLQTIDRAPATVLAHPQFLRLSRASVIRMLSRDSFYIPEVAVLHAVQAWLDADYQARLSKFATLCAPSSSLSVSVSSPLGHDEQQQLKYPTLAANAVLSAPPTLPPVGRKHPLVPGTRSNSSESLFSSASTSDSVASCGTKSKVNDNGQSALEELRTQFERETADIRVELVGCIRFELMSLSELSTEVRASRLLSPDDLLDKISAKTQLISNQLPIRGRLLPEVNLAVPRLGCSLLKGQWGNYPFFFVDNGDPLSAADQSLQTSGRRDRYHQSRSIWDASCDWMATSSRPYDREVQLRGRGDALANASAWGFMENVAISTPAAGKRQH
uniref:BTB domain-containing protein n=1 Tax=Mesocestoides corti TaxID=53468 RepID=A0A5K3G048_MESCO